MRKLHYINFVYPSDCWAFNFLYYYIIIFTVVQSVVVDSITKYKPMHKSTHMQYINARAYTQAWTHTCSLLLVAEVPRESRFLLSTE